MQKDSTYKKPNPKKARVFILISSTADFRMKNISGDNQEYFKMMKGQLIKET